MQLVSGYPGIHGSHPVRVTTRSGWLHSASFRKTIDTVILSGSEESPEFWQPVTKLRTTIIYKIKCSTKNKNLIGDKSTKLWTFVCIFTNIRQIILVDK